jgi:hypothetical protein
MYINMEDDTYSIVDINEDDILISDVYYDNNTNYYEDSLLLPDIPVIVEPYYSPNIEHNISDKIPHRFPYRDPNETVETNLFFSIIKECLLCPSFVVYFITEFY